MHRLLLPILLCVSMVGWAGNTRNFYVDSFSGGKVANGSMEFPFKSLDALEDVKFLPGDCIHLAGNQILNGNIHLKGVKGTPDNPLIITSYGAGISQIYSAHTSAVVIDDCENIHVKNVVVKGSGRKNGNTGTGIEVINSRFIEIEEVEAYGFQVNGIGVNGGGDVRITHSYVHDNGSNGIEVTGEWNTKSVRNIYIGYCVAENNAGNPTVSDNHSGSGILVGHATCAMIEYCEAMNNGWDMPRSGMQYNLAMNNEGAGYGLFQFAGATEWNNNIIRYNVSVNDGIKNSHAGIYVWCDPYNKELPLCNTKVHDNLIISNQGHSISFNTGFSSGLEFSDNVFVLTNEGIKHLQGDETKNMAIYKGNCYWSEAAERQRISQPRVSEDTKARYEKMEYILPEKIDILRLKEILSGMLPERYDVTKTE